MPDLTPDQWRAIVREAARLGYCHEPLPEHLREALHATWEQLHALDLRADTKLRAGKETLEHLGLRYFDELCDWARRLPRPETPPPF